MFVAKRWMVASLALLWVWGDLLGGVALGGTVRSAKEIYQRQCQSCHGADGKGNPQLEKTLKVTIPLVTGEALKQKNDAAMLQILAEGKGKMPGYAKNISSEEQQQLLTYMKTLGQP